MVEPNLCGHAGGNGRTWDRTRDLSRVKRRQELQLAAPARVHGVFASESRRQSCDRFRTPVDILFTCSRPQCRLRDCSVRVRQRVRELHRRRCAFLIVRLKLAARLSSTEAALGEEDADRDFQLRAMSSMGNAEIRVGG